MHGDGADEAVCGTVDIDEPQDNFDGPERFVYVDGGLTLDEVDGNDVVSARWRDVCEG